MVAPDFTSARHKINRAHDHLDCLDVQIDAWLETNPYAIGRAPCRATAKQEMRQRLDLVQAPGERTTPLGPRFDGARAKDARLDSSRTVAGVATLNQKH